MEDIVRGLVVSPAWVQYQLHCGLPAPLQAVISYQTAWPRPDVPVLPVSSETWLSILG